jgi:alkaline phosphatase D
MNRRTLLKTASLAALGYPLQRVFAIQSTPQFSADPFAAGVASGDPTRSGVVLWTRLIPDPKSERDWQRDAVPVDWEIASEEQEQHRAALPTAFVSPSRRVSSGRPVTTLPTRT